jgi:hypothetical protein
MTRMWIFQQYVTDAYVKMEQNCHNYGQNEQIES